METSRLRLQMERAISVFHLASVFQGIVPQERDLHGQGIGICQMALQTGAPVGERNRLVCHPQGSSMEGGRGSTDPPY